MNPSEVESNGSRKVVAPVVIFMTNAAARFPLSAGSGSRACATGGLLPTAAWPRERGIGAGVHTGSPKLTPVQTAGAVFADREQTTQVRSIDLVVTKYTSAASGWGT
ncbi:hypothetical protein [Actinokineospora baliensis]|uniref:hypothetical protein n=1 Tax=Actinokineospora baliensis TaxID=547056 RepID=UPI0019574419|nr:hypothetical protein [Actinokineospora baliensis]